MSSTEAEYIVLTESVKEAVWLRGIVSEMFSGDSNVTIHCDSQSALALSKNPTYHDRTKHIDVRFHYIREVDQEGAIKLMKIHTEINPADMMTRALTGSRLESLCQLLKLDYG